ncbi:unnamed protein product [Gongylonema pulchrum]|uniref:PIK helical domain-containing protein n=1 Tax=Gongylonema pulchrum TaxID=637853 RepID=A0A183DU89_9BILA|nr:unnamed protein product [Gongylonema pulchrum]
MKLIATQVTGTLTSDLTSVARVLLNKTDIQARAAATVLEVLPCTSLDNDSYRLLQTVLIDRLKELDSSAIWYWALRSRTTPPLLPVQGNIIQMQEPTEQHEQAMQWPSRTRGLDPSVAEVASNKTD